VPVRVGVVLAAAELGVVVGRLPRSEVSDPRMPDKMLPRPVLSMLLDAAADGVGVTRALIPAVEEGAARSVKLARIEERRSKDPPMLEEAAALGVTDAVVVGAADEGGATTLETSEIMLSSNEIRAGTLEGAAGAVVAALPENEAPLVTLAAAVLAAADVRTPPGPKVIPLPTAEEAVEVTSATRLDRTLVGRTMICGIDPDEAADEAAAVEGSKRADSMGGIKAWVGEDPSGPTIVVCEITTVVTPSLLAAAGKSIEDEALAGCDGEKRLSIRFPVVPAELVSLLLPVIPLNKSDKERLVEDELNTSWLVSFGLWVVIVEFLNIGRLICLGK
jgi:hypothetical protein